MTKGRRSYSYTDSYGFLSHLSFLYPPFPLVSLLFRFTSPTLLLPFDALPLPSLSALIGWRVAVSVAESQQISLI